LKDDPAHHGASTSFSLNQIIDIIKKEKMCSGIRADVLK